MGFDAPEIVWSQCQTQLQNELPEQQYNTWIRPLKLKYFDDNKDTFNDPSNDDVVELLAPNSLLRTGSKVSFSIVLRSCSTN
jgi:chromosomal replication initiator protein